MKKEIIKISKEDKAEHADEFEEDIVKKTIAEYNEIKEHRRSLELQWRLNMNFLYGNQYAEITPIGDIEDYGKQYYWQEREVYNHIAPIIESRLAKLGRVKASVSVRPFSNDDDDIKIATLSTSVLRATVEDNNFSKMLNEGNFWAEICGSVFYKVIWDSDSGRKIGNFKGKDVYEGDVRIELCPAYEIFPSSLTASSVDDLEYIIHARAYSVDEVKNTWEIDCKGSNIETFSPDLSDFGGGLGYSANNTKIGIKSAKNSVLVIEKYERPSYDYPDGRYIIVAGDKLAHYGILPYAVDSNGKAGLPFVKQSALNNVASFFGTTVIERIIPLQRSYNAIKNRKHEFLNRIAMGIMTVEEGAIDIESLEDDGLAPGRVLVYRQGYNPPRMVEMGSVPNDYIVEEDRLRNEIMQISGVSELMRYSTLPSSVTSGVAISLLQEQDDTRISITADKIREAVRTVGQYILRLYKQYAVNKRIKRIAGVNGAIQIHYFKGSDLASDDLVFDTDNALSDTPANRRSMVFDLIKLGIMHDENGKMSERNRLKILEMLGFGNWESGKDVAECHREKALRENIEALNNDVTAIEVDNHELHIVEHTKAVISDNVSEIVRDRLLKHIKEHQSFEVLGNGLNIGQTEGQ